MESLWNLEDKFNLSTREAVLVLASTALVLVCVCTVTVLKRRARTKQIKTTHVSEPETVPGGARQTLMGSVRWSAASKWKESPRPLLRGERKEGEVGWGSHNSDSPVWQRPILMGEKCEFPKFSGLILYDQKGMPVFDTERENSQQEMKGTVERTTLRDLL